jgi:hypothetical protein
MSFNENVQLDTSQVESGGRSSGGGFGGSGGSFPGGIQVGGGIGGLILLILMMIFGGGCDRRRQHPDARHLDHWQPEQPPGSRSGERRRPAERRLLQVQDRSRRQPRRPVPHHRDGQQRPGLLGVSCCRSTASSTPRHRPSSTPAPPSPAVAPRPTRSGRSTARWTAGSTLTRRSSMSFPAGSAPTAATWPRSTSSPTSTATTSRTSSGILGKAQQDPQGPQSGAVASSSWPTVWPARGSSTPPRPRTPTASVPQADHPEGHRVGPVGRLGRR